jgi:hypothetical protein
MERTDPLGKILRPFNPLTLLSDESERRLRFRRAYLEGWRFGTYSERLVQVMSPSRKWYQCRDGWCSCPSRKRPCKHSKLLAELGGEEGVRDCIRFWGKRLEEESSDTV